MGICSSAPEYEPTPVEKDDGGPLGNLIPIELLKRSIEQSVHMGYLTHRYIDENKGTAKLPNNSMKLKRYLAMVDACTHAALVFKENPNDVSKIMPACEAIDVLGAPPPEVKLELEKDLGPGEFLDFNDIDDSDPSEDLPTLASYAAMPCIRLLPPGGLPKDGFKRDHIGECKLLKDKVAQNIEPSPREAIALLRDLQRCLILEYRENALEVLKDITWKFNKSNLIAQLVCAGAIPAMLEIIEKLKGHRTIRIFGLMILSQILQDFRCEPPIAVNDRSAVAQRSGAYHIVIEGMKSELLDDVGDVDPELSLAVYQESAVVLWALCANPDFADSMSLKTGSRLIKILCVVRDMICDEGYTSYVNPLILRITKAGFAHSPPHEAPAEYDLYEKTVYEQHAFMLSRIKGNRRTLFNINESLSIVHGIHKYMLNPRIVENGIDICIFMIAGRNADAIKTQLLKHGLHFACVKVLIQYDKIDLHRVKSLALRCLHSICGNNEDLLKDIISTFFPSPNNSKVADRSKSLLKSLEHIISKASAADPLNTIQKDDQEDKIVLPSLKLILSICKFCKIEMLVSKEDAGKLHSVIYLAMKYHFTSRPIRFFGTLISKHMERCYYKWGISPWTVTMKEHEAFLANKEITIAVAPVQKNAGRRKSVHLFQSVESPIDPATLGSASVPEGAHSDALGKLHIDKPQGSAWPILKRPRGAKFFSLNQERWLVLDAGTLKYYDLDDCADPTKPPYVKANAKAKNEVNGGLGGCKVQKWFDQFSGGIGRRNSALGGNDELTVMVIVSAKKSDDKNLILQFESAEDCKEFLQLFPLHEKYGAATAGL
jgi:hypothetical protein